MVATDPILLQTTNSFQRGDAKGVVAAILASESEGGSPQNPRVLAARGEGGSAPGPPRQDKEEKATFNLDVSHPQDMGSGTYIFHSKL